LLSVSWRRSFKKRKEDLGDHKAGRELLSPVISVGERFMWKEYVNAASTEQVLDILKEKKGKARIIAGGTDLLLEMHQGLHDQIETLIDISRIDGYDEIYLDDDGWIHLGPTVTHNHCVSSKIIRDHALPLALAAWEVGAPQIRNIGTVIGNLVTASPANDTIVPLYALNAELILKSRGGERRVALRDFYTGVRRHILEPEEFVQEIIFPAMEKNQRGIYLKLGLRKAQAISLVNMAAILTLEKKKVSAVQITLGAVAPTIIHATEAEDFLVGKELSDEIIEEVSRLAQGSAKPIDDIRSSAVYRQEVTRVLVKRGLSAIAEGKEADSLPEDPVFLWDPAAEQSPKLDQSEIFFNDKTPIETTINGEEFTFQSGQNTSILHLLREFAGLTGSKVGCEEGECGACTLFLDGKAVMSCLIPAPRAHKAQIVTIEGIAEGEELHPVQEKFITEGAVQCGYCTPGFIMSAVKLLEEESKPSRDQIISAISGNLCRCTGYYKIIRAIEEAN
jgi:carbon-monoxide dehydrogenase medium subunit